MATPLLQTIKNQKTVYTTFYASGAGARTRFFPVDPRFKTLIQIDKNGEDVTTEVTAATREPTSVAATVDNGGGEEIADLETAAFVQVDTGTDDYLASDGTPITCVKVAATPVSANVNIIISQFTDK